MVQRIKIRNCRFCNRRLSGDDKSCPGCGKKQHYIPELLALLLLILSTWFVVFKLDGDWFKEQEPPPPTPAKAQESPDRRTGYTYYRPPYTIATPSRQRPTPPRPVVQPEATPERAQQPLPNYRGTQLQQLPGQYPFYVAERKWNPTTRRYDFFRRGMHGSERANPFDNRFSILSENQRNYPVPESGCGPIALLNLFIWYKTNGLLEESVRYADPELYKQHTFKRIDQKIAEIKGHSRTPAHGTNVLEQVVAIDELAQEHSRAPIRIHFEIKNAPLTATDFLNIAHHHRFGILSGRPRAPDSTTLRGYHAVLVVRGDTAGTITIANWGTFQHGLLINRPDGQWFVPDDATQYEMLLSQLVTLIPFTPASG